MITRIFRLNDLSIFMVEWNAIILVYGLRYLFGEFLWWMLEGREGGGEGKREWEGPPFGMWQYEESPSDNDWWWLCSGGSFYTWPQP